MARIQKPKSEYEQKLIDLRRVARVMAGGRRFTFRAAMVIGNQRGQVGFGLGKAADTSQAIEKAVRRARQNLISVPLTKDQSIPHEIYAKFGSARVILKPAKSGKGLVAGGSARAVLAMAGVKNVSAKILSHTKNKLTNALATLEALKKLKTLK
ncbi:30S ribosomal protein S5 [Candidatus Giovannonibacteria bacterium RIFCSPLOWO2_01_FULL_43_160]|uniref:Small ribosomal subunit protein uS5 n=2 Tax=Candidatus Giovannoniibacteriota TaxID=1752738 RepID=A0A0G1L4Q0_9BACT|nr:MAG: 30S ribosomal protein S5 [Candidatus Giovannonibacteria bacterium GW2011_GWB1_43_13]KKS99861.1 MAG: 30S ribosomal protein S5 [Candidatus Giovannonibacteria bacterium GW2011_GWA1_43_15]KKT21045.1 MAG: 30S ribosomal protein S5 [Candidatus Giovannonibacteria bacterium GW2011_GWC2_43_8]KKT63562.1 MAG: 30S ribosomal protein S5 [Candidatus Giovannonibacteria bacterium GW2011_GWA2_44_26]OGF58563.1 MAG: 30S ribosomal protein S5 [Candidatus Giovannonibacteria bacterium RIFCSPHIGHO2_01_FULL_43_14